VEHVTRVEDARERLTSGRYGAILSETQLPDGSWTDVLDLVSRRDPNAVLIVTDRLADDRLWGEVLNLGAYDLLAQPFDASEVQRILSSACLHNFRKPACAQTARPDTISATF
jgi:DNA-binding NtrC family response regulator